MDPEQGDLSRPGIVAFWIDQIGKGRAVASVQGPPCETWSTVRFVLCEGGPPPVRASTSLWGNTDMKAKYHRQVTLANKLLMAALDIFTALVASGGVSVLEHPAMLDQQDAPSIWKLPVVRALVAHPCVEVVTFSQSHHGQCGPKPTTRMAVRAPTLKTHVRNSDLAINVIKLQPRTLVGKAEEGTWRTAPAK